MPRLSPALACALLPLALVAGCASPSMTMKPFDAASVPAPVQTPAAHKVALETVGVGQITYQCRAKAEMASQFEWVFVAPDAKLMDRSGRQLGRYFGPPATWEAMDGSKITGAQVAVAPGAAGSIPLQLVKANPAMGSGAMTGVSYVQRVATQGGIAPAAACGLSNSGASMVVPYRADYIFYKPA